MRFVSYGRLAWFAAIFSLLVTVLPSGHAQAGFRVAEDAFSISNAPGYCFAMAAFSRWYYLIHQGEPPLRKTLDRKAQQQIARELQSFYSRNLITLQAEYCNKYQGNQTESFKRFVEGILKGEPRIVLLMNKGPKGAVLHAVLAYAYLADQNLLRVYDPNYTNEERIIDLERREYTSLDITYNAICFPEVLHQHPPLVRKMEALFDQHIDKRAVVMPAAWGSAPALRGSGSKRERNPRGQSKE